MRKYNDVPQRQHRIGAGFTWRKRWAWLCRGHVAQFRIVVSRRHDPPRSYGGAPMDRQKSTGRTNSPMGGLGSRTRPPSWYSRTYLRHPRLGAGNANLRNWPQWVRHCSDWFSSRSYWILFWSDANAARPSRHHSFIFWFSVSPFLLGRVKR